MKKKYKYLDTIVEAEPFELGMEDGWIDTERKIKYPHCANNNCKPYVTVDSYVKVSAIMSGDFFIVYYKGHKYALAKEFFEKRYREIK